jgi:hypothetical protein
VLIGSLDGMTVFGAIELAMALQEEKSADSFTLPAGYTVAASAAEGFVFGGVIGSLTIVLKKSETYLINGDTTNWKMFQRALAGDTK